MEIQILRNDGHLRVVSGVRRLKAMLSIQDEVLLDVPGLGPLLIVKLPDGQLIGTQDDQTLTIFGGGLPGGKA